MNKTLFIGRFSESDATNNQHGSAAGDLVQRQIIIESQKILGESNLYYINMRPQRAWPHGKIWASGLYKSNGYTPPLLNIPILRSIFFSLNLFYFIVKINPKTIITYNCFILDSIILVLSKQLLKKKIIAIAQDVRTGNQFSRLQRVHDLASYNLLKYFDFSLPVTEKLAQHLKLWKTKYTVFPGAPTLPSIACEVISPTENIAVFAGALERYNGIDRVIHAWDKQNINTPLHIFGNGSLADYVKKAAKKSSKIVYHGFLPPQEVYEWQTKAKFNICLRYSDNMNEEFFFPSKFFNSCCYPGLLLANKFKGIPEFILSSPGIVKEDLADLKKIDSISTQEIISTNRLIKEKINSDYSWREALKKIYAKFKATHSQKNE